MAINHVTTVDRRGWFNELLSVRGNARPLIHEFVRGTTTTTKVIQLEDNKYRHKFFVVLVQLQFRGNGAFLGAGK